MKKTLIILLSFVISFNLYGGSKEDENSFFNNWEFSMGGNLSSFSESNSLKELGFDINIYKRIMLYDRYILKIGLSRKNVNTLLKDKIVRTHGNMGSGPYQLIKYKSMKDYFVSNEVNIFLSYKLFRFNEKYYVSPFIGGGYSFIRGRKEKYKIDTIEESEKPFNNVSYVNYEKYDETQPIILHNSGLNLQGGITFNMDQFFTNIAYCKYLQQFKYNSNGYIKYNKFVTSISLSLGINF